MSATSDIAAAVRAMAAERTPGWAAVRNIASETAAAQAAALREAAAMIEAEFYVPRKEIPVPRKMASLEKLAAETGTQEGVKPAEGKA